MKTRSLMALLGLAVIGINPHLDKNKLERIARRGKKNKRPCGKPEISKAAARRLRQREAQRTKLD